MTRNALTKNVGHQRTLASQINRWPSDPNEDLWTPLTIACGVFNGIIVYDISVSADLKNELNPYIRVYSNEIDIAAELLRGVRKPDGYGVARAAAAATSLITDVRRLVAAVRYPSHETDKFRKHEDRVSRAAFALTRAADQLDADAAIEWRRGFKEVLDDHDRLFPHYPKIKTDKALDVVVKAQMIGNHPQRKPIATDLRALIWNKTGGVCWYCGAQTNPFTDFHVDHFVPVVDGGVNDPQNLVPSCQRCNSEKGAMHVESFRAKRGGCIFWFERGRR